MKMTSSLIKIGVQICWLFVNIAIAMIAIRFILSMYHSIKSELSGAQIISGRIVR